MTISLVILLIIILIIIGFYFKLKKDVENFSLSLFGTKNFLEGFNKHKQDFEETPKTPMGMERLVMPDLIKDFPNMNVEEMKKLSEENILNFLHSIEQKDVAKFNNPSEKLLKDIANTINTYKKDDIKFENISAHQTVVNTYKRATSVCTLIFQTSIGFNCTKNSVSKKVETRFNTEYIYIYNTKNIKSTESISLKCPNCGAPIEGLGFKVCPYCNAGLIDLAPKTWKLNDIKMLK